MLLMVLPPAMAVTVIVGVVVEVIVVVVKGVKVTEGVVGEGVGRVEVGVGVGVGGPTDKRLGLVWKMSL